MEHVGTCGLCGETNKELQRSHLYQASAYKHLRDPTAPNGPNPVVFTRDQARTTSKQVRSHFLCKECEQRFSDRGERYVLAQLWGADGQFKLRELLEASSPIVKEVNPTSEYVYEIYDAQRLLGSHINEYVYYAASMFWRASAHSWTMEGKQIAKISLGMSQEDFRRYLLGEVSFPENARIWLTVATEHKDPILALIIGPHTYPMHGFTSLCYKFLICGVCFDLFLGSDASTQFDNFALNGNGQQRMYRAPLREDPLFSDTLKLVALTKPSGKLRK